MLFIFVFHLFEWCSGKKMLLALEHRLFEKNVFENCNLMVFGKLSSSYLFYRNMFLSFTSPPVFDTTVSRKS